MYVVRYIVYGLYLFGDAILSVKIGVVTFFGMCLVVIVKMLYKEARPYWTNPDILAFRCENDFEGPCDHLFILTFFYTYINLIYLRKYIK